MSILHATGSNAIRLLHLQQQSYSISAATRQKQQQQQQLQAATAEEAVKQTQENYFPCADD